MLTIGVALFATFSGFLANFFLSAKSDEPAPPTRSDGSVEAALHEVTRLLEEQQRATATLSARLADLTR